MTLRMRCVARTIPVMVLLILAVGWSVPARAETGYDLWLRYRPVDETWRSAYRQALSAVVVQQSSPTGQAVLSELQRGLRGLLGGDVPAAGSVQSAGALLVGTPASSPLIAGLGWQPRLKALGDEGYVIRSATVGGHSAIVIASHGEIGTLYGAFHLLRLIQTRQPIATSISSSAPGSSGGSSITGTTSTAASSAATPGASLWRWDDLPGRVDPRIEDYARANASIGINGSVINNVNANPRALTPPILREGGRRRARTPAVRHPRLHVGESLARRG